MSRNPHARLLIPASALVLAAPAAAQEEIYPVRGSYDLATAGTAVAQAGDANLDGCTDYVIGSPTAKANGRDSGEVRLISGASGQPLVVVDGAVPGERLGSAVDGVGDVSGDGIGDFLAGAPDHDTADADAGRVVVISGADGSTLFEVTGTDQDEQVGFAVAGLGDFDLDGTPDYAYSLPGVGSSGAAPGTVVVRSGADHSILASLDGSFGADGFGWSIDGAGDTNNDGFADLVVGAIGADVLDVNTGEITVHQGPTGTIGFSASGSNPFESLGWSVSGAGDVDDDGMDDVIAGAPFHPGAGTDYGLVRVYSPSLGGVLYSKSGGADFDWAGWSVSGAGDLNGDGHAEFAYGAPYTSETGAFNGSVRVFDGMSGAELFDIQGPQDNSEFGFALDEGGDCNGDGVLDLVIGSPIDASSGLELGAMRVYSTEDLLISTDGYELSLASGGITTIRIEPGIQHAGKTYLFLGSVTGPKPQLVLDGHVLALGFDVYTSYMLSAPNQPPFTSSIGTVDSQGRGLMIFSLPTGTNPNLEGVTLYHAAVVLGAFTVDVTTETLPLTLVQ